MNTGAAAYQPIKRLESLPILLRISKLDKSAVGDCVSMYGNLIWGLAKRVTNSDEEAEIVTLEIFNDIWNCARQFNPAKCTEEKYILRVAIRHLVTFSQRRRH